MAELRLPRFEGRDERARSNLRSRARSARGARERRVPGWGVKTDMGGPHASRDVDTGARGIVWAATLPVNGPTGGFFRDGKPIEW